MDDSDRSDDVVNPLGIAECCEGSTYELLEK
jgi:hypothetical protein